MHSPGDKAWRWALGTLVVAGTLAAFAPSLGNGFVDWDDGIYIRDNPFIRGLTLANLRWMLTSVRGGLGLPLTWLSFAVDHAFWGLEPAGYHFTNVLLHAAAALVFYAVVLQLLEAAGDGSRGAVDHAVAAAAAALFFAVHPLRVESVAWATERKDVLSGMLWLAAVFARLKAAQGRGRAGWEAAALTAFALALTAKISAVTLPCVLLILEVYPLRRLPADPRRWLAPPLRPVWLSVLPYFFLAAGGLSLAAFGLAANTAEAGIGGAQWGHRVHAPAWRIGQSLYGLLFYPMKTLWPFPLSPYHPPQTWFGRWSWESVACGALVLAAAAAIWRSGRRRPAVPAAFACYAIILSPVVGIIPNGIPASAWEHHSYLPCLGLAVLFGALVGQAASLGRPQRTAALAATSLILAALGAASWRQTYIWRDSRTLWTHTAMQAPDCPLALNNFGVTAGQEGRWEEAVSRLSAAVASAPRYLRARENLGAALVRLGRREEAIALWRAGLALDPSRLLRSRLGRLLSEGPAAEQAEGERLLRQALSGCVDCAETHFDLAAQLARQGRVPEAEAAYAEALRLAPAYGLAHNNLGLLLDGRGRAAEAESHFREALSVPAARALAHYNWGNSLSNRGELERARRHYVEAVRIAPGMIQAEFNLGNTLARQRRYREAAARYRSVLRRDPRFAPAGANLRQVLRLSGY
ncbi:MAG: hypothetical protein A2X36_11170 [Elusimicrobia bacterium GWA2_69_24]|nr:MAG: hypothetical protein A2X36_11170 [Elusimicrobia bacterium GWA2_69_24]HBL15660.1 hypothetical protein [Elusimicrobiota bacterium]